MTDRLKGVIVTFDHDIRVDDAEQILTAIQLIKGVLSVKPLVSDIEQHIAEERVRREIYQKILKVVYPEIEG